MRIGIFAGENEFGNCGIFVDNVENVDKMVRSGNLPAYKRRKYAEKQGKRKKRLSDHVDEFMHKKIHMLNLPKCA
ncbi:MAG: hypothetical protein ACLU5G_02595 [Blautia sp.]